MDSDGLKFCFIDTETTGLTDNSNIIELAWVITDKHLNVLKEESHLINGNFEITEFIKNLTGISKEKTVADGILIQDALKRFYNDILKCQFLVAHNILFDYKMIMNEIKNIFSHDGHKNELEHYTHIFQSKVRLCSLLILKKECKDRDITTENYKLQTFYNRLIDEPRVQIHRALSDVYMIIECFQEFYDFDILKYFWNKHLSFGKHKRKTNEWIYDNDKEYFNWLLQNVYNVDTLYKKDELLYKDEEYEYDDFIVPDMDNLENIQYQNSMDNQNNDYVEINDDSNDSSFSEESGEETDTATLSSIETDLEPNPDSSDSSDNDDEENLNTSNINTNISNKRQRTL
jgi:DNA polymerase III epsilon subunit-like protein